MKKTGIDSSRGTIGGRAQWPGLVLATCGLTLLTVMVTAAAPGAETPRHPETLTLPPLSFTPIAAEQETLSCGVPVILHESHDLPILDVTIRFRMGNRYLPVGQHTACGLLADLWRDGGTALLSPDSLDAVLTALDASISSGVGERSGSVEVRLSSEDTERALPIWRDVVLRPRFDGDRLARAKANRLESLQEINNDPNAIASHHFRRLLLGREFPSARLEPRADIEAVKAGDLSDLHARFVRPQNAIIGVSGDFDRRGMLALLENLFRDWPAAGAFEPPIAAPWEPQPQPGVYLLRGDYAQSQVRLGRIIPELTDDSPDLAAASLLSWGLGYQRIFYRTREEGLTYGTALLLDVGRERTLFQGSGSCRGDATVPLLRAVLGEYERLGREPVDRGDLAGARSFMIGNEVRASETAAGIVATRVGDLLRGRKADFRERYFETLKSATAEDVAQVARRYVLRDEPWVVFVLGDPEQFGVPLDSLGLGPVREVEPIVFGE